MCVFIFVLFGYGLAPALEREVECQTAPQAISGKCEKRLLVGAWSSGGGVGPILGFLFMLVS